MPLPPALAARLAKRGLLTGKRNDSKRESKKIIHEEVIAEDYDNAKDDFNPGDIGQKFMGFNGCPNKYNIFHDCTKKCTDLWGKGNLHPSEKYLKKQLKLIQKYPLPDSWKAIYDPGSGQHYYWDWSSDLVSWLPPGHPKSQISQPASQLREDLHLKEAEKDDDVSSNESGSDQEQEIHEPESKRERKEIRDKDTHDRDRDVARDNKPKSADFRRHYHHHHNRFNDKNRDNKKDRTLDPMDPAAYSDIPRGKWSDGLAKNNEAKTGVDTTASGPLFQMRPYPSPGAVLRSNKENKDKEKDKEKRNSGSENDEN